MYFFFYFKKKRKGRRRRNKTPINVRPKTCNLCGGQVVYVTNDQIYKKQYGSGYCYLCLDCRAYVGTHKPRPKEALGLLANPKMRELKKECHFYFDKMWHNPKQRNSAYKWLANEMNIPRKRCHFGYFDEENLMKALKILKSHN